MVLPPASALELKAGLSGVSAVEGPNTWSFPFGDLSGLLVLLDGQFVRFLVDYSCIFLTCTSSLTATTS